MVLAAAGVWVAGMLVVSLFFLFALSDMGPNIGALAAPLVAILLVFEYGVVGAFLVAFLSGIAVAVLNELDFFAPWSRTWVRVWALTTSLATLGALAVGYPFSPALRSSVHTVLGL